MIDINIIRNNPDFVRENLERRNEPQKLNMLDDFQEVDLLWRKLQTEINELRRKRNIISSKIAVFKKQGVITNDLLEEADKIQEKISGLKIKVETQRKKVRNIHMHIPNLLHESVPYGENENDNIEIRRWGKAPKFGFNAKNHFEIAKSLRFIDEERANKVAGTGFYYLKGELALLDLALQRFAIDFLMRQGYTLIEPPFMLRRKPYEGVTDLSDFETVMYKIQDEDHYLIATSEHPIAAMYMNETLNMNDLPLKFIGISTNFRKEIGTHGRYTKGLYRMHQFNKIEQFIFCLPKHSWKMHEELQWNCEKLYQKLGLHYRVVDVCTGDIGIVPARKYDTEIWMVDDNFREAGSNSNCTSYQARRLNIKYREGLGKPPKDYVHTLNSTALATSRTLIGILEQYQLKNGNVSIPKVLRSYMNDIEYLKET
jgi:seryl-tRNA synthetase